jgi:hypothetical protein
LRFKEWRNVRYWHLADSPTAPAFVRYWRDCVAKLFAALRERNDRIRLNASLNQYCVSAFVLESMLLGFVVKIVLQHYRHKADILPFRGASMSTVGAGGTTEALHHRLTRS